MIDQLFGVVVLVVSAVCMQYHDRVKQQSMDESDHSSSPVVTVRSGQFIITFTVFPARCDLVVVVVALLSGAERTQILTVTQ